MAEGALAGLVVVECGGGLAGAFAAKAMADYGADVIKVEPPGGDPARTRGPFPGDVPHVEKSGQFLYLNANKRGVTLDLGADEGRTALHRLLRGADILISDMPPTEFEATGLDYGALAADNPRLIWTAITSFGLTGPYRDFRGGDLVTWHMGGTGHGTPFNAVTDPEHQPPLRGGGYQAEYLTGWTAASATMAAVFYRKTYGRGQIVDVSRLESVANMMRPTFALHSYDKSAIPAHRGKTASPWIFPCADGYVSISMLRDHWWEALKDVMGRPEWAESEAFATSAGRRTNSDALDPGLCEWFAGHTRQDLYAMLQPRGIPCFPVYTVGEMTVAPQYVARGSIAVQEHPVAGTIRQPGASIRYSATPWELRRPAPLLGQHNAELLDNPKPFALSREPVERSKDETSNQLGALATVTQNTPLKGVRVIDFGWILSVPHCTSWLGTLGAEIIRVESNKSLDAVRAGGPADGILGPNRGASFNGLNYSKKGITLNVATPRGHELALELIRGADIVTQNYATGVIDKLGLGYEALREVNPGIVMVTGSTLGVTGPERMSSGWGPNVCAYAGLPSISGHAGGPPGDLGGTWPDYAIGTMMVFGILAALHHRQATGEGQHIEVAMGEAVTAMIPEAVLDFTMNGRERPRMGNRDYHMAPHDVYPCAGDDLWIAIEVESDRVWRSFCEVIGRHELADDSRYATAAARLGRQDELDEIVSGWTRQRSPSEAMHALQAGGVAAGPVMNVFDQMTDPHFAAREWVVEMDHLEVGPRTVAGLPAKFSAMPQLAYTPVPCLGQHNAEIFGGLLGLSVEEQALLEEEQVIF